MLKIPARLLSKLIVIAIIVGTLVAVGNAYWNRLIISSGPLTTEKIIVIESGSSLSKIAETLQKEQVITNPKLFYWSARSMRLGDKLKAGEYVFTPAISLQHVLLKLSKGEVISHKVTIPEGFTVKEILTKLAAEKDLKGEVTSTTELPEGSLMPETYAYSYGQTRTQLLQHMQAAMETALNTAWKNRDKSIPLKSPLELLTLASIVEKETGTPSEREDVAAVYVNRLKKGMKLQADPTVIYGAKEYHGNLTKKHLQTFTPYNTYVIQGLPVGPICNPGKASLEAAAHPSSSTALYFVADGKGGHAFASTNEEHAANVRKYIMAYREQNKKSKKN